MARASSASRAQQDPFSGHVLHSLALTSLALARVRSLSSQSTGRLAHPGPSLLPAIGYERGTGGRRQRPGRDNRAADPVQGRAAGRCSDAGVRNHRDRDSLDGTGPEVEGEGETVQRACNRRRRRRPGAAAEVQSLRRSERPLRVRPGPSHLHCLHQPQARLPGHGAACVCSLRSCRSFSTRSLPEVPM